MAGRKSGFGPVAGNIALLLISSVISLCLAEYLFRAIKELQWTPRPSIRYKYVISWLLAYVKEQINYYVFNGKPLLHTGVNIHSDFLVAARENGPKWAEGRQAFADMAALCKERSIPFLVVIFPAHTERLDDQYPFRLIHEEVMRWADANAVQAVDMLAYLKDKNYKEYMVEGDGHPNGKAFAETARVVAPIIHEYLQGSSQLLAH